MRGRSIILAGGSGGLGAELASLLASRGAVPIIGFKSNKQRALSLARAIAEQHAVDAPVVEGDIRDSAVRERLIREAERAGVLYGAVPLVGEPARVPIETASEDDFLNSFAANFIGPVLLARDFFAALGGRDGAVVFVSTMQAIGVFPGSTTYAAPKAALVHTARILAKQWPVRVNVVAPGVNDAGMAQQSVRNRKYDSFIEKGAIPRFGNASDVARAIAFLLEPDNYITGQILTVDGGLTTKM